MENILSIIKLSSVEEKIAELIANLKGECLIVWHRRGVNINCSKMTDEKNKKEFSLASYLFNLDYWVVFPCYTLVYRNNRSMYHKFKSSMEGTCIQVHHKIDPFILEPLLRELNGLKITMQDMFGYNKKIIK